jgi:anti-sigma factor RsiW
MSEPPQLSTDRTLRAYLLGTLTDDERAAVEERMFEDDESHAALLAMQDELIDGYARGELAAWERERLERGLFATEDGRARLRFARALAAVTQTAEAPAPRGPIHGARPRTPLNASPGLLPAIAALLALAVAGSIWLTIDNVRLRREVARLAASPTTSAPTVELAPARTLPGERRVVALSLSASRMRGGREAPRIELSADADVLRVSLVLVDDVPSVDVIVEGPSAGPLEQRGLRRSPLGTVDVLLDARSLEAGPYEFLVWSGHGDQRALLGAYACEVVRP